jgi:hypothetical protein
MDFVIPQALPEVIVILLVLALLALMVHVHYRRSRNQERIKKALEAGVDRLSEGKQPITIRDYAI